MLVEDVEEAYRPGSFCCAAKGPKKAEKEVHLPVLGGRIGVHNGWDFGHHAGPVVLVFFVIYINPFPYELAKS